MGQPVRQPGERREALNGFLSAWLVEAGIITWRSFKRDKRPPLPSDFVAVFVVYGSLGLLAEAPHAQGVATATGWGIVLATALNLVDPAHPLAGRPLDRAVPAQPGNAKLTATLQRPVRN